MPTTRLVFSADAASRSLLVAEQEAQTGVICHLVDFIPPWEFRPREGTAVDQMTTLIDRVSRTIARGMRALEADPAVKRRVGRDAFARCVWCLRAGGAREIEQAPQA